MYEVLSMLAKMEFLDQGPERLRTVVVGAFTGGQWRERQKEERGEGAGLRSCLGGAGCL